MHEAEIFKKTRDQFSHSSMTRINNGRCLWHPLVIHRNRHPEIIFFLPVKTIFESPPGSTFLGYFKVQPAAIVKSSSFTPWFHILDCGVRLCHLGATLCLTFMQLSPMLPSAVNENNRILLGAKFTYVTDLKK